jgi:hypothetical protein
MSSAVAADSKWLGGGQQLDDWAYRGGNCGWVPAVTVMVVDTMARVFGKIYEWSASPRLMIDVTK